MLRIRKTRWKIGYVAFAAFVLVALSVWTRSYSLPDPMYSVVANLLTVLLYFGGVRSFRGAGEPLEPPRALWRMTSRPRAGFVIGSILILNSAYGVFSAATQPEYFTFAYVLGAAVEASLAFLYFRSSIRLRRVPPQAMSDVPRWKPMKR